MNAILEDARAPNFQACLQCGACTGVCPAATLDKNYNPRRLVQCLLTGSDFSGIPLHLCYSCYSCKYACPVLNSVTDIVKILRDAELQNPNSFYQSVHDTGLTVRLDCIPPEKYPEWGERWREIYGQIPDIKADMGLDVYRKLPGESIAEIQALIKTAKSVTIRKAVGANPKFPRDDGLSADKIYLFHSCIADAQYPGIFGSIKYLFNRLQIDYIDDPKHSTCTGFGYYANEIPFPVTLALAIRNFALAEESGHNNIATVCPTSYGLLNKCCKLLQGGIADQMNEEVIRPVMHKEYKGNVSVGHVSEVLWLKRKELKEHVENRFDGLRVAVHDGCHYTKIFRERAIPHLLEDIVRLTGAEVADYAEASLCCGMGYEHVIKPEQRHYTREIAARKLISIKEADADVIVVACPGCQVTFDRNQKLIEEENDVALNLPTINYAQFLALALGAKENVVGLRCHSVPFTRSA